MTLAQVHLGIEKKISAKLAELLNGESVDIAFVTHNDDDHIGGFKYLIENKINIKRFVFNSLSNIKHVIKNSSNKISTKQDINLDRIVKDGSFVFSTLTSDDSPILIRNIKITPITPSKNILLKYLEQQERKNTEIKISSSSEKYSIKEALQLLSNGNDMFVKDPSATNKTSLSFMIEYGNFCGLFLGDAHEEDIYSYMANHCANRKISFNVVKLAHHGSEKNTSSRLLKLIGTTEYIICANKT
ncbi:MBL fold metallo-hydrolase, partial [Escherichia coli]